jgi:hypothetical protein
MGRPEGGLGPPFLETAGGWQLPKTPWPSSNGYDRGSVNGIGDSPQFLDRSPKAASQPCGRRDLRIGGDGGIRTLDTVARMTL